MRKRMTIVEALTICDVAETASAKAVREAYEVLMINAPCWAFSQDEQDQRNFLKTVREGPQQ